MKKYKYSELKKSAQKIAAQEYINGWLQTHPDDDMTLNEAHEFCLDSDDEVLFSAQGAQLDEEV